MIYSLFVLFGGCSAIDLYQESDQIEVVSEKPKNCKYLGQVRGSQGNFFTGMWTSNANLEQGAMNDLRNNASKLGADTIYLLTNRAAQTGSSGEYGGSSSQTSTVLIGNAYKCQINKKS
ncbi:MAG: DUF4156 domain-containing protein [Legionellales bacterium]|nr:DUF4156 domain-containing protein [Legionellales bacterium]